MVNFSIGIDIVDVERFRKIPFTSNDTFYKKDFTSLEIDYCLKFKDPYVRFAGKFALKEATIKALKKKIAFSEIEIDHGENDEPIVKIDSEKSFIHASLSHEKNIAVGVVFLY